MLRSSLQLLAVLATTLILSGAEADSRKTRPRVLAYLPEYRQWDDLKRWSQTLDAVTDLVLFSVECTASGDLTSLDRLPPKEILDAASLLAIEKEANLLVCIGGNGRSAGLAKAIATERGRIHLARQLRDLVDSRGFHGVDVDYESPSSDADWTNLRLFLKELKASFLSPKMLSLAIHPGQEESVVSHSIDALVDLVSIMAYDNLCQIPRSSPPCHHSTLEFAHFVVQHALSTGLAPSKLLLGVPFYARHTHTGEARPYYEVASKVSSPGEDEVESYSFNNAETLGQKADLAISQGFGGVMIWEVGQDLAPESALSLLGGLQSHLATREDGSPLPPQKSRLMRMKDRRAKRNKKEL